MGDRPRRAGRAHGRQPPQPRRRLRARLPRRPGHPVPGPRARPEPAPGLQPREAGEAEAGLRRRGRDDDRRQLDPAQRRRQRRAAGERGVGQGPRPAGARLPDRGPDRRGRPRPQAGRPADGARLRDAAHAGRARASGSATSTTTRSTRPSRRRCSARWPPGRTPRSAGRSSASTAPSARSTAPSSTSTAAALAAGHPFAATGGADRRRRSPSSSTKPARAAASSASAPPAARASSPFSRAPEALVSGSLRAAGQCAGALGAGRPARPAAPGRARALPRGQAGPRRCGRSAAPPPARRLERALKANLDRIGVERAGAEGRAKALVFDASGIADSTELVELQRFFYPAVGRLQRNGRAIVLGIPAAEAGSPRAATAQRALEGFTRSLGKEIGGRGATAQLVLVGAGGEDQLESTLRFLLSPRSAYVSGQVIEVGQGVAPLPELDWERPLAGRTALVTGASRGIGAAIAATLARDGAQVVGLDVPQAARRAGRRHGRDRRRRARARHHRRRGPASGSPSASPTASTSSSTTPASPGPDDREDARGALGDADGDQPLQRGADQRRAARRRPAAPPTAGSSASPRCRGSPATPARPTTRPRRPA